MATRVLIVDDDVELAGLLRFALEQAGYEVYAAYDGNQALERFESVAPELVVLDVNLPGRDGYAVLAELRRRSDLPVLMLTVRASEDDEVRGLDLGADDYLRKPFSPRALLARMRALLRRQADEGGGDGQEPLQLGPLLVDVAHSRAQIGERPPFRLSALELRLLRLLGSHSPRPVDASRILSHVWSDRDGVDRDALKQLVHRLRAKLEAGGGEARWIEYVPQAGYAFAARAGPDEA